MRALRHCAGCENARTMTFFYTSHHMRADGGGMCSNGGVYANGVCLPPGQQYYGGGYMVRCPRSTDERAR